MTYGLSRLRLCLPALTCILMLFGVLSTASAAEWGELSHVHIPLGAEEGHIDFAGPNSLLAFAADSSDRDFYVGDEPQKGEYRIQRFSAAGTGEASISFTPPSPKKTVSGFASEGLQLAVDPARNRVYALVLYRRRGIDEAEEKAQEKEEKQYEKEVEEEKEGKKAPDSRLIKEPYERKPLDFEELAAGDLYAFEYAGGKLVSVKAGGEGPEPILGEGPLKAQGEEPKEALLDPRGLAVDPATGNLAILGVQDEEADAAVEKEEAAKQCRGAAQFIIPEVKTGQLKGGKLGARFADNADALDPGETSCEPEEQTEVPVSPAFTPDGNLLVSSFSSVESEGLIWEFPTPSAKVAEHQEFETHPTLLFAESTVAPLLELAPPESGAGPNMSFVAEGTSGKIYIASKYKLNFAAVLALQYTGASGGNPANVSEIGWSAGGQGTSCNIPQPFGQAIFLGAFNEDGGKEGVDIFDAFAEEITNTPRIEDFSYGPGGNRTGCPKPLLTSPTAAVGENKDAHQLAAGETAILSSALTGANAMSVEWKLKYKNPLTSEESTETITTEDQGEAPELEDKFKQGEYEIGEIVHTDDLAEQQLTAPEPLKLTVTSQSITIKFAAVKAVRASEEEAAVEATVTDPNEEKVNLEKIVWSFGDGSKAIETKGQAGEPNPTVLHIAHAFISRCTGKCTVSLTVEDSDGASKAGTISVTVNESKAEEAARKAKEEEQRKAEEEAQHKAEAEAAQRKAEEEAQHKAAEEAAQRKAAEEAATKKRQEEEAAAKKKHEEEEARKKHPTRAQLLAKALRSCKKQPRTKRSKCEATARKKYGSKPKGKKKKK